MHLASIMISIYYFFQWIKNGFWTPIFYNNAVLAICFCHPGFRQKQNKNKNSKTHRSNISGWKMAKLINNQDFKTKAHTPSNKPHGFFSIH